ncbi:MAG: hypothetical protein ACOX60_03250 [Massiliimalia sp.]|jgi:hypothetical protein
MEKVNRYEFEGEVVEVPLIWDERTQTYQENYKGFIEHPVCTPKGRPVFLTIEDACPDGEMVDDDPLSIDCGSCRYYHQFSGSLLGICQNEKRRSGQETSACCGANKEE